MKFIAGTSRDSVSVAICAALGVDPKSVRRIVIDLEVGSAARVYYETFADDKKLAVAFESGLKLAGTEEEAA